MAAIERAHKKLGMREFGFHQLDNLVGRFLLVHADEDSFRRRRA